MKNLIVLLFMGLTGTSCLGVVAAQELLVTPPASGVEDNVPELAMPAMPEPALGGDQQGGESYSEQNATTSNADTSDADSWEIADTAEQFEPYVSDDYQMFQRNDPVLESTGTWIRRGFWYAEVDTVLFNRKWSRDVFVLATQPIGTVTTPIRGTEVTENQLIINGSKPGVEAAPRFTLGHFLFRDHKNRDHVAEFTVYGGGEWSQEALLNANPNNDLGTSNLDIPVMTDGGNTSFDGATSARFRYDSRFNSFEVNYLVKERMGRDHMEMEPSGHWVRRAGPSISRSLLAGFRFFDLNENFAWDASGIDTDGNVVTPGEDGNIRIRTDNDMIGTQLGFSWFYETARWSAGARAKGGIFLNLIDSRTSSAIPNATDTVVTDTALEADEMAFIGETALIGKWHLRPNFSLRVGMEMLFLTSTALAPSQVMGSFLPSGPTSIVSSGDPIYLGGSIGFEGYW